MKRLAEFFEGSGGRLSMPRLLCFLSFFIASYITVENRNNDNIDVLLGLYLGMFVGSYLGGKTADIFMNKGGQNASLSDTKDTV
jgi:uncharacterized membrane protein YfcA